jgi:hypothetical protein
MENLQKIFDIFKNADYPYLQGSGYGTLYIGITIPKHVDEDLVNYLDKLSTDAFPIQITLQKPNIREYFIEIYSGVRFIKSVDGVDSSYIRCNYCSNSLYYYARTNLTNTQDTFGKRCQECRTIMCKNCIKIHNCIKKGIGVTSNTSSVCRSLIYECKDHSFKPVKPIIHDTCYNCQKQQLENINVVNKIFTYCDDCLKQSKNTSSFKYIDKYKNICEYTDIGSILDWYPVYSHKTSYYVVIVLCNINKKSKYYKKTAYLKSGKFFNTDKFLNQTTMAEIFKKN